MSDVEEKLKPLRLAVAEQGNLVKKLKEEKANDIDIQRAVTELKTRKRDLDAMVEALIPKEEKIDRGKMEDLLKRRFFYDQSFSIYGGVNGLYDYGPMGCAMKANLINEWRRQFVLEEQMFEVSCSMLTPTCVLEASGHVARFTDFMVKDKKNGECFRADHLIEANLEKLMSDKKATQESKDEMDSYIRQLDNMSADEMHAVITKYNMKSPVSGNDLSEPVAFNLMFATSIGPTGLIKGFLRPETAQGMFVNFKRLLEFNQGKLPFAAAQIGSSFRNEISPRSGLLRVREFEQAEVEHFCDPNDKSHPKFADVAHLQMTMYSACNQVSGQSPQNLVIGEAVKSGLVANETLGYFIAKIFKFLTKCGINPKKLRFRQHMSNEMAHYAQDCWDAECHTSYGWVELVGCADRSAFDLEQHAKHANVKLVAEKQLPKVKEVPVAKIVAEKSVIGKLFKKDAKLINDYLAGLTLEQVDEVEAKIKEGGQVELTVADKKFSVPAANLECKRYTELVHVEEFVPSVIEPSMGIGRILYTIWEHNFKERDAQRNYLAVPVVLAPYKCSLLPLSNNEEFRPMIKELSSMLTENGISYKLDDSAGSIGKRYARTDEISIPFGLTIDFESLKEPKSVTLRERDSMEQVRLNVDVLLSVLNGLISQKLTWKDVTSKYPLLAAKEE